MTHDEFVKIVRTHVTNRIGEQAILSAAQQLISSQNSGNAPVRCCKDYYLEKLRQLDIALVHGSDKIEHSKAMDFHLRIAGALELIRELEAL